MGLKAINGFDNMINVKENVILIGRLQTFYEESITKRHVLAQI
jgi:hypothetical protein